MLTLILSIGCSTLAHAQDTGGRAKRQASAQRDKPAKKAKRSRAERKRGKARAAAPKDAPKAEQAVPAQASEPEPEREGEGAQGEKQTAESELDQGDVREEDGTQVKVMEFSGLDIEGQLKTPQMLYFLNRLRAEFGRPRLPHRSFMPELQAGTADKAMR